ncbi:hypothetical protein JCM10450v2_006465 [Rhodotorula kratochvilovae]
MPVATLPVELVLTIIETCIHLEKDREKTLAALCRLAKRYKGSAERLLYSRVALVAWHERNPFPRWSAMHTLKHDPRLGACVKSVELLIADEYVQDPLVATVLQDLPNVEEISLAHSSTAAIEQLLTQNDVLVRGLKSGAHPNDVSTLLRDHAAAFTALARLDLEYLPILAPPISTITSLSLMYLDTPEFFTSFTSPFSSSLTSLRLPLGTQLAKHTLAAFRNLKHLSLFHIPLFHIHLDTEGLEEAIPCVKPLLATTASLAVFDSLAVEGTLFVKTFTAGSENLLASATGMGASRPSKAILDAIPSQIQRLSLVTNIVLAHDLATFLSGLSRPCGLRTLRIGRVVGRGLQALMSEEDGPFSRLAKVLEEAGVEVTTVG